MDPLQPEAAGSSTSRSCSSSRATSTSTGIAGSERCFRAAARGGPASRRSSSSSRSRTAAPGPSDAKDPKGAPARAQQLTEFLGRLSGGLRPSLAIVMAPHAAGPGPGEWLQDAGTWSEKKLVHALVLPAAQVGADEWCKQHLAQIFATLPAEPAAPAAVAAHRAQKLTGEVFSGCKALLAADAALAKALFDEPYNIPAIPPWRSEEGWRPKPLEVRPQAGSGRWTFPASDGPLVMTLDGGLKGEASWTARARLAGVYDVYTWVAPTRTWARSRSTSWRRSAASRPSRSGSARWRTAAGGSSDRSTCRGRRVRGRALRRDREGRHEGQRDRPAAAPVRSAREPAVG
jgi:hypothetical protein